MSNRSSSVSTIKIFGVSPKRNVLCNARFDSSRRRIGGTQKLSSTRGDEKIVSTRDGENLGRGWVNQRRRERLDKRSIGHGLRGRLGVDLNERVVVH
jgi:hypothetical protein